jgi:hypothetical protein
MSVEVSRFDRSQSKLILGKYESPVVTLELAKSHNIFAVILSEGDPTYNARILRINTYLDYCFIVLYWLVFMLFARLYVSRLSPFACHEAGVAESVSQQERSGSLEDV